MSCALTQGYNLDCRNSIGGIKEVHLIEFANVTAVTVTAGVTTGITKATAKQFYKYSLIRQTGTAEETLTANEENGSVFVTQSIKFPINKLQASVRNELLLVAQNRLMAVVVDQNGIGWLYGYQYGILIKNAKAMTGTKWGDRNGYDLEFEGFEPAFAIQVDNTTLGTLETPGV